MLKTLISKNAMFLHLPASKSWHFEVQSFNNRVMNLSCSLYATLELIKNLVSRHNFESLKQML